MLDLAEDLDLPEDPLPLGRLDQLVLLVYFNREQPVGLLLATLADGRVGPAPQGLLQVDHPGLEFSAGVDDGEFAVIDGFFFDGFEFGDEEGVGVGGRALDGFHLGVGLVVGALQGLCIGPALSGAIDCGFHAIKILPLGAAPRVHR